MPEVAVHSVEGQAVGRLALDDALFGVEARPDLVHAAVVAQLAARRAGTHKALTRGEVRGGGRKPYRQKGTGRARQGSIVAPQWKGGGVAFPPVPRDYRQRLPRKVRRKALLSAWSAHVADQSLVVVDALELAEAKTRQAEAVLRALVGSLAEREAAATQPPAERPEGDSRPVRRVRQRRHLLVMLADGEDAARRALANLRQLEFRGADKITILYTVHLATAPYASVYDLTLADAVVASQAALERVRAEFSGRGADGADGEQAE